MVSRNISNPGKECQVHCYPQINLAQFAIVNPLQRTEGGGAGAYQASQMRICPQGGQQQDPKQQPQQTTVPVLVTGGMQHNMYSNRQNAMNYYQPRGSSHNQRMTAQPRPINVVYQAAHGGSMNNPIYMQQMVLPQNVTFNMQQPPRHQSHGAGTPNPQAANIAFPQSYYVPSAQQQLQNYPYAPTPYLQMPMRNQQAVPNSAQFSQQQQPQQLQVAQQTLSNPAGQSMVTLLPQNAPSGMPVSHQIQHNQFRPKKRPERALLITHPVTGEDVLKDLWEINEGGEERVSASNTPQPEESIEKATVAAEFASKVAVAVSSDSPLVQSEAVANGPTSRSVSPPPEPPQPLKLPISEQIPTVSAKTNSPTVELHRHQPVTKPSPLAQPHYLPQQIHIPLNNPQPISQSIAQPPYSPPSPSPPPQQPEVQAQPQAQPQLPPQRPLSPATKVDAPRTQSTSPTRKNQQVAQVQNEKAKLKKEEMPAPKKDAPKVRSISPPTPTQPQTPVVTASTPLPQEPSPKSEPVERQPSPSPQVQPFIEDTNGETDDAVKAQQRPKANKQKKKDLNRKGVEKEGTDMDAFQVADEHVETPEDPPEVEKDVADAIVAAKNEENNKVSANNNNNESPDESQVIESMTIERSEPQLQYHYKESQWSPINTEGKKVYDREFLMEVRNNPLSIKRPEKLANESLLRETPNVISSTRRLHSSSNSIGSLPKGDNMNSYIRSSSSQRGMSRQGGMRNSLPKPMGHGSMHKNMMKSGSSGYNMHGMYRDEPNLHKVANSWKPSRLINNTNLSEEELKTEVLLKTMRGILNKLTPQKFDRLLEKVNKLDINNEDRMKKVVDLVFEKAIDEPSFSTMYAQLCFALQLMKVQVVKEKVDEATPQSVGFRKVLLLKCQHEFEKTKEDELDIDARQKQIAETKDQDKRKELLLAFEEDERKIRIKSVGLVRFIGELFKKNMLTHNIMHQCITVLIEKTDEESLECLCKLLTTIGKDLESKSTGGEFNNYFATMKKLSHKSPDSKISSRIRFMLQDVIELRANKWIPRRDENKPKTIEQIQKDAEKETFMESFQSSMSSNMNRGNRNDDRRRTQKNQVSEDGWHNVNKTRSSNYTLESQKLMNMKSGLEPENLLGKPGQFNQWSMGAKRQNTENKNFTSANKFDILQSQEDRKLPLYGSSGRKGVTPSPSIEKERAIAGVKAMRGSGSGPNSRESSRSRYGSSPATSISKEEKVREPEPKPQEEMTEELDEQLSRSTRLVIDEYFSNKNSDEAYESIQDVFAATNRLKIFIEKSLSHVTENTNAEKRARFANLLVILIKDKKLLPKKDIIEGFSKIMDNEDLITDLPLMWQYLAQLLAPLIAQEALDFQDFKLASKQIAKENVSKLLVEIITFLIKDKGPCWISTQWESCHMNIKDFVPDNENIDKFITDKKLGFLTGSAEYPLQPDESLTCEEIEEKLLKFLKNDTNKAIDHTCDWIKANVSDKTKGTTLVKALTRASIKGSLVKEKFCGNAFEVNMRLIKKYVDNDEKYELACLYAAQHLLANEIVSPPTVIQEIFESLYTSGTISFEGFMKWKETKMSEENEVGKGVLLSVLSSFFVMLSENSNDTEEES